VTRARSSELAIGEDEDVEARVGALYRRHRDQVYRIALRYCRGDSTWAEDVTQDVFVSVCRTIDRVVEDDDMSGWFYRVAHNACLSRLRREEVVNRPTVRWLLRRRAPQPADPEKLIGDRQEVRRIFEVMDALAPKQRVAFSMYYLDGKEQTEIGEILGYSKSYVCKLIKLAEATLSRGSSWTTDSD
jgi:RNA polymerase sigma-70 factor (ECF subfamily)